MVQESEKVKKELISDCVPGINDPKKDNQKQPLADN
jgi:hypothetical protein